MKSFVHLLIILLLIVPNFLTSDPTDNNLIVISPNGGESYFTNSEVIIRWKLFPDNNEQKNFVIILYKSGIKYYTVSRETDSNGEFIWHIPDNFKEGSDYRIRIRLKNDLSVNDFSDSDFSIKKGGN